MASEQWPLEFVQAYCEDAFGPRRWCDEQSAAVRLFVANTLTVFGAPDPAEAPALRLRYHNAAAREQIVQYVVDTAKFLLEHDRNARAACVRTLERLMTLAPVRAIGAQHLRNWLRDHALAARARTLAATLLDHAVHAGEHAHVVAVLQCADLLVRGESGGANDADDFDQALHSTLAESSEIAALALGVAVDAALDTSSTAAAESYVRLLRHAVDTMPHCEKLLAQHLRSAAAKINRHASSSGADDDDELLLRVTRGRRRLVCHWGFFFFLPFFFFFFLYYCSAVG